MKKTVAVEEMEGAGSTGTWPSWGVGPCEMEGEGAWGGANLVDTLFHKGRLEELVVFDNVVLELGVYQDLLGIDERLLQPRRTYIQGELREMRGEQSSLQAAARSSDQRQPTASG